jgi:hypothetical protein
MKRPITTVALVALLCAAVGAYAALGGTDRASPAKAGHAHDSPVRIVGRMSGLFPGATAKLNANARNRTDEPVRLVWVKTRVRAASRDCAGSYLHAKRIQPRLLIPANGNKSLRIPVKLSAATPDSCQRGKFPLRFRTRVASPVAVR